MNRKHWMQLAVTLSLAASSLGLGAQSPAEVSKVKLSAVTSPAGVASQASPYPASAIVFGSAAMAAAPQQLTATFTLDSTLSGVIPTASLHYGHDFSLGAISCSGQSCSVTVSFSPTLPGPRPDALFLTDGTNRLATISLSGVGDAPYALLQPFAPSPGTNTSGATAVLDENGTAYLLDPSQGTVTAIDAAGKSTQLAISGLISPRGLAIDGAGMLYILNGGVDASVITFDSVQSIQGSRSIRVPAGTVDSISVGVTGELYAISSSAHSMYTVSPDGTVAKTALQGSSASSGSSSAVVLGAGGGLALGGSTLQTVSKGGAQAQVSLASSGSVSVLGSDAAGTLYANSGSSLLQLAAPAFGSVVGALPSALAVGSDGSLVWASGQTVGRLDRTETSLYFDPSSTSSTPQLALLYNAGNAPLAISDISVSGTGFAIASTSGTTCVAGVVVAAGASCDIGVTLDTAGHPAVSGNGAVTVTSNSLNQTSAQNKIILRPHLQGSQATLSASTLSFPSTTVKVASAPLTATLTNGGTAALNITSIALSGGNSASYSTTNNCPTGSTSLAAGASCTITVIFTPLSPGTLTALITVLDDAGQTAPMTTTQPLTLTGIAVAAPAPVTTLSLTSYTFAGTAVATEIVDGTPTPPTEPITITNTGNATLNISSIAINTGLNTIFPFSQTNTCGATLAASASCVVTVTFAPPEGGPSGGSAYSGTTLVITDNSVGSPHIVTLTGNTVADDYTLTTSTPTVTISSSGGSGYFQLTATPDPGPFPTPVDFIVLGMPGGAVYSFTPSSINPSTGPATASLNVLLPAYQNAVLSKLDGSAKIKLVYGPVAACLMVGLMFASRRGRLPRLTRVLQIALLSLLGVAATSLSACGGIPQTSGVAPGTYPLAITANSANGAATCIAQTYSSSAICPQGYATHQVVVNLIVK